MPALATSFTVTLILFPLLCLCLAVRKVMIHGYDSLDPTLSLSLSLSLSLCVCVCVCVCVCGERGEFVNVWDWTERRENLCRIFLS
jgi:hypothetical protein